jgi:hypothetical protein
VGGFLISQQSREMLEKRAKGIQAVPDTPGATREIGNEHLSPGPNQTTRKGREGSRRFPPSPHHLSQPRRFPIQNSGGGFRGDVPGTKPRTPGRENHINLSAIGPLKKKRYEFGCLIGEGGPKGHTMPLQAAPFLDGHSTGILPLSSAARVGNGEYTYSEQPRIRLRHRLMEPSV